MVVFLFVVMTGKRAGEQVCFVVCTITKDDEK